MLVFTALVIFTGHFNQDFFSNLFFMAAIPSECTINKPGQKGYSKPELTVCRFKHAEGGGDEAHGFGTSYLTSTRDFFRVFTLTKCECIFLRI